MSNVCVMTIRDRRHANMSKQRTSLVGFNVSLSIGVFSRDHMTMFFIENEEHQEIYMYSRAIIMKM